MCALHLGNFASKYGFFVQVLSNKTKGGSGYAYPARLLCFTVMDTLLIFVFTPSSPLGKNKKYPVFIQGPLNCYRSYIYKSLILLLGGWTQVLIWKAHKPIATIQV